MHWLHPGSRPTCYLGITLLLVSLNSVHRARGEPLPSHTTTCAACRWVQQHPDAKVSLDSETGLPDLRVFADGSRVTSKSDWQARRLELKALIQHYAYGCMPPAGDRVAVRHEVTQDRDDCKAIEERLTLVIDGPELMTMRLAVYRPRSSKGEPLPVLLREEHALGHVEEVADIVDRDYLFVEFAREDLAPDQADSEGSAKRAYPDNEWGTLAVWAWGAMRVVDYLVTRADVDSRRIGIVGHSRGGKMALLAGALDERFALVAANGSGCGGAGCYRISAGQVETLELITRPDRFGYWFHPRLRNYANDETRLPVDQHFLKALIAPRALICTDAEGDVWANPVGNRATSRAAQSIFDWLGAGHKNGLHFRAGQHDLTRRDWQAILEFADWHFKQHPPENPRVYRQF